MMRNEERVREQFEDFLSSWFDEHDRALLAPKGLAQLKAAFEAGYLARDAEVQALRRGLDLIRRLHDSLEQDVEAVLREAVDIANCAIEDADAALAGEGGDEQ